jgi:hypothetical protein
MIADLIEELIVRMDENQLKLMMCCEYGKEEGKTMEEKGQRNSLYVSEGECGLGRSCHTWCGRGPKLAKLGRVEGTS